MKSKKGNVGMYITVIIGLVLAVLLLVNLAFPQWRTTTTAQTYSESLTEHTRGLTNTTDVLTNTDLVAASVTVAGLNSSNFTTDYTTATVIIYNDTANGTYTASYSYYAAGYIESTGSRAFASVVILLIIAGLFAGAFKMFGLF